MRRILLLIILILIFSILLAEDFIMPVMVDYSGDDSVGGRLVYEFKEEIKKSESMRLSLIDEFGIRISIITMDSNKSDTGYSTVYSIVWLWNTPGDPFPFYLTSSVGYCGSSRVSEVAKDLVAATYEQSEAMLKVLISIFQNTNAENE